MQTPTATDPRLALLRKDYKDNCLNGVTLYETVDLQVLEKLINSDLLKTTFNNKICKVWHQNEKQQLEKYRDKIIAGRAKIQYNKAKNNPFGRSNPDGGVGLYNIRREIRHTLASENYVDIDIDNCHPVLLLQTLQRAGIESPCLQSYVENRQTWFDKVNKHWKITQSDRVKNEPHLIKDIPKDLFIRMLFGGGSRKWAEKWGLECETMNPDIVNFEREVSIINEWIAMANPHLLEITRKNKENSHNVNGTCTSFYLQECEVQILEVVFKYCSRNRYIQNENAVLCADGLMIEKRFYKPQLIQELQTEIKEKTGYDLKMSNKAMELGFNNVLDKHLCFNFNEYSTATIANVFKVLYMNEFVFVNGSLYEYNGVYWRQHADKRFTPLHMRIEGDFLKYMCKSICKMIKDLNEEPKIEGVENNNSSKMSNLNKTMGMILKSCNNNGPRKSLVDDIIFAITSDYIEMDMHQNLLAFDNAIYDLDTATWVKPHYKQYISITTGWNWNPAGADHTCLDDQLKKIFPKKSIRDHYLTILSTGLWGKPVEKIFNAKGVGGNGKGVLNELMMSAVGGYGYTLPSSVFISEIKEGANPAIANLHKKRFVVGSEPDAKRTINASTIKTLTGGASLNSRGLYSSNCMIELRLTLIMECNDQPKFDEVNDAVARRLDVIPFDSKFREQYKYDEMTCGMSEADIEKHQIFLSDSYFKTDEFKDDNRQALVEMMLPFFEKFRKNGYNFTEIPEECKAASKEYMSMSDDISNWFSENFDEKSDSVVMVKDVYSIFTHTELYMNMTKQDKRTNNLNKFTQRLKENMFIGKHYREKDSYHNKIRHKAAYIAGFVKKSKYADVDETEGEAEAK